MNFLVAIAFRHLHEHILFRQKPRHQYKIPREPLGHGVCTCIAAQIRRSIGDHCRRIHEADDRAQKNGHKIAVTLHLARQQISPHPHHGLPHGIGSRPSCRQQLAQPPIIVSSLTKKGLGEASALLRHAFFQRRNLPCHQHLLFLSRIGKVRSRIRQLRRLRPGKKSVLHRQNGQLRLHRCAVGQK